MLFSSIKKINRLTKEINRLLSKGYSGFNGCSLIQLKKRTS